MFRTGIAATIALFSAVATVGAQAWTESSFEDFKDGRFLDGGSNLYVSAKGRLQIINRWDMNADGFLDIMMPSGHAHTEKEDTYIYLNNGSDIDGRLQVRLAANGSRDGLVRDFNKDGLDDIAVCNGDNGIHNKTNSYIYYGAKGGYGTAEGTGQGQRTTLPSYASTSIAAGDFNGDGWTDVAIASNWQEGDPVEPKGPKTSFVYYNGPDGFKADRRVAFSFDDDSIVAVAAGDLDGDQRDDLVLATPKKSVICLAAKNAIEDAAGRVEVPVGGNSVAIGNVTGDGAADLVLASGDGVTVLVGAGDGIKHDRQVRLEAKGASDVALADLDCDGRMDIAVANSHGADGAAWVNSYVYFSDGKEFATRKRLELPSMGASAVSAGDLDGDGRAELVISNQHVNNQNSIPSVVYWNRSDVTFDASSRTELETQGAVGNAIGDFNHDGKRDVVFFNFEGNFRDGASISSVLHGDGTRNFSPLRGIEIPTHYITSVAHADLDDDDRMDLVLTQSRFINGAKEDIFNSVLICWGEDPTYRTRTRLTVDYLAGGVRITDLNRDGHLDLIVGAYSVDESNSGKKALPVFWGSANGYSQRNQTLIAPVADYPRVPLVADVNRDGYLDFVSQVEFGSIEFWYGGPEGIPQQQSSHKLDLGRMDNLVFLESADLNKDGWLDLILPCRSIGKNAEVSSFIYYGSPDGYSNDRREEVMTRGSYEVSVADLDKDSWLDIFITSYKGNFKRNFPSNIYWGSSSGFNARPGTDIPTLAASGIETADYDGDGWIDLLISNHRLDGSLDEPGPHNHKTASMLYWGGSSGYSPQHRWDFITNGPHAMNIRNVGNGVDRGLYEDYISSPHELPSGEQPSRLTWKGQTPHGTKIEFQLRSADSSEALTEAAWQGPNGKDSWYTSPDNELSNLNGKWIQYRARLITPNGGPTPYLDEVTVSNVR